MVSPLPDHIRGLTLVRSSATNLGALGAHLNFLARTGHARRGLDLVVEHLDLLHGLHTPSNRCDTLTGAVTVLERITACGGGDTRLPASRPGSPTPVAALGQRWRSEVLELAAAFDKRNGTSRWTDRITAVLTEEPLLDALLPLDA